MKLPWRFVATYVLFFACTDRRGDKNDSSQTVSPLIPKTSSKSEALEPLVGVSISTSLVPAYETSAMKAATPVKNPVTNPQKSTFSLPPPSHGTQFRSAREVFDEAKKHPINGKLLEPPSPPPGFKPAQLKSRDEAMAVIQKQSVALGIAPLTVPEVPSMSNETARKKGEELMKIDLEKLKAQRKN